MKVYILSDYGEYGSVNVMATLDKDKVLSLLIDSELGCGNRLDTVKKLTGLLDADEINDGEDLEDNWGGSMLHIIELV